MAEDCTERNWRLIRFRRTKWDLQSFNVDYNSSAIKRCARHLICCCLCAQRDEEEKNIEFKFCQSKVKKI